MQIDPHTSSLHCGCTAAPSTHLDVGARLVRHLHDELAALAVGLVHQVVQDVQVHGGPQVVDVGHEDVLLALRDQLLQQARVVEAGVDVPVARRVPGLADLAARRHVLGDGEQRVLVDPRVPALVEGVDLHPVVFVLLQDLLRVLVRVEGVHEDERHVGVEGFVQMLKEKNARSLPHFSQEMVASPSLMRLHLDLLHRQVQEGVLAAHADQALGALAAHAGPQAAVQFDHGQLVEAGADVVGETLRPDPLVGTDLSGDTET